MSSLNTLPTALPTELLLSILHHTPSTADRRHVGLACKRLHQVATPLLYTDISLEWSSTTESPRAITLLLRSFMENPQLGASVKDLHLHGQAFLSWSILTPPISTDDLDLHRVAELIHGFRVPLPHAQEWEDEFRKGKMDAVITLLLSFLPNLARLRMLSNFAKETRILSLTMKADLDASCGGGDGLGLGAVLPMLRSLEHVTIHRWRNSYRLTKEDNTAETLLCFYLPNIRSLDLAIDNPTAFAWPLDRPPCPSLLHSLRMCIIREPHAQQILAACHGLKHVDWTILYKPDQPVDISEPIFDMQAVNASLQPLRETVEDLTLIAKTHKGVSDLEEPDVEIHGSLQLAEFAAVKSLTISWALVMGMTPKAGMRLGPSFPRNVQELEFLTDGWGLSYIDAWEWDEFSMLEAFEPFLASYKVKEHVPLLRRVGLHIEEDISTWSYQGRRELEYLCTRVGLECSIVHDNDLGPPFDSPPPGFVWRAPESLSDSK